MDATRRGKVSLGTPARASGLSKSGNSAILLMLLLFISTLFPCAESERKIKNMSKSG
jgi:hypothetical protein